VSTARARNTPLVIRERRRVRALESPVRQEIVDAVAGAGAGTIAQIGEWVGRRPDTLYYHIRALVRVGLLERVGRRRAGKRFGAVYDVPGRPVRMSLGGEAGPEDLARVLRSALRLADRDFRRALRSGEGRTTGESRNIWGGRFRGRVRAADLPRVGRLIDELTGLLQRGGGSESGGVHTMTLVFTPVPARTGRPYAKGRGRKGAGT
jgi:DNA-binding transcriptional ArsR family regulator